MTLTKCLLSSPVAFYSEKQETSDKTLARMVVEHPSNESKCKTYNMVYDSHSVKFSTFIKNYILTTLLKVLPLYSKIPPVEHQPLGSEVHQLLREKLVDYPRVRWLLRLLQSDLLQGSRYSSAHQPSEAEEEPSGNRQDDNAGLLRPGQQQHDPSSVHSHAGRSDNTEQREPAQRLGSRSFASELRRRSYNLWDVQTIGTACAWT